MTVFFLLAVFTSKGQNIAWTEPLGLDTSVHRGTLSNGLTYYIVRNKNQKGEIELALIEKAGAYHGDKPADQGVAHLVEHLSFRATKDFPQGLKKQMTDIGLVFGRDYNAATSESTDYIMSIHANDSSALKLGLIAMRSFAKGRLYDAVEVEQERSAVLNEITPSSDPSFMSLLEARYQILDQNRLYLPHVPTEIKNMQEVTVDRLKNFDETWYTPDQQALIIIGDVDVKKIEQLVNEVFSALERSKNIKPDSLDYRKYEVPVTGRLKRIVVGHGSENPSTDIKIYYKQKSSASIGGPNSKAEIKTGVIDKLVNALINERFKAITKTSDDKDIQSTSALFYRREIHPWAGLDAILAHGVISGTKGIMDLTAFLLRETERIKKFGFTNDEFSIAKDIVRKDMIKDHDRSSSNLIRNKLANNFLYGSSYRVFPETFRLSILDSLSLQDVNRALKDWMNNDKADIDVVYLTANPQSLEIPTSSEIASLVDKISREELPHFSDPNKDRILVAPLSATQLVELPVPSQRLRTSKIDGLDATQLLLANGVKVILKRLGPHDEHRSTWAQVNLKAFKKGGTSQYISENYRSASISAQLVAMSGLGNSNRFQLRQWLNAQKKNGYLNVTPFITEFEQGISGISSLHNSENMLMMTYLYFVNPHADVEVFNQSFSASITKPVNPAHIFDETVSKEIAKGPFDFPLQEDDKVNFNESFKIYKRCFSNPADYTFVITGYFDLEMMTKQVAKYLGAIPSLAIKSHDEVRSKVKLMLNKGKNIKVPGGSAINTYIRLVVPIQKKLLLPDQLEMRVFNEMLRGLLFERLRTKDGLVYSVSTSFVATPLGYSNFSVEFSCSPENVKKAIESITNVFENLNLDKVDESLFNTAKQTIDNSLVGELDTAPFWINYIELQVINNQKLSALVSPLKYLNNITKQSVGKLANDLIDINNLSLFQF